MHRRNIFFFILIITIIIIGFIIISGNFLNKSVRPPQISISDEAWDFGKVMPGTQLQHKFIISNKGTEDLIIERVWVSCECIKTSIFTTHILPGKSTELQAIFNTAGYVGMIEKTIYIKSNDPGVPEKQIKLKTEIELQSKPKINISTTEWNMGLISQGDTLNLSFSIENQGNADLIIDKIDTFEHVQYNTALPLKIFPKEKFELVLTYDSTYHELGDVKETVRIYCNDLITKSLVIRISGYIKDKDTPEISISPTEAIFNLSADSEEGVIRKFTIKNSGAETIKIISIKSSVDYFTPLRSELSLKPREEKDLQVVLLKDKVREETIENKTEEYLYLTIAIPMKINK